MDQHFNGGSPMNRTVEKDKTLLVEGPASVIVISGKTEIFGHAVRPSSQVVKVVIREGKRLPFAVEEATTFDLALAEKATVEEVVGNTVPQSWVKVAEELLGVQGKPAVAMVLGTTDSGKTSLCTYLVNRLLIQKKKVAVLDGDLGQSDIGPPCTVAYTYVTKPLTDLFNLRARDARFIGTTSPSSVTEKVKEAMASLKKEALESNLDYVLVNSDGWIEGDDAVNYKQQLIETINPDIIIGIQKNDELTNLLSTLGKYQKVIVESPQIINQRSREKRKNLRELGYQKYLRNSKLLSFPLGWLKIENGDLLGLTRTRQSIKEARRIHDLLGMKPLHIAEQSDRITIIIGKKRWINAENLKKAEEATKKKVIVVRKGEEEGLLTGLYNSDGKFLGIGVIQEIDYLRKTLKFLTSVSETIATASIGKVKLDKNLKEVPSFDEENQSEFTTFNKLS